ncbi:30S ribosomal protein S8e [Trichinella spiralis]|uniref:30S ribosomal protein S8e n=1 Tax=Trichinella spiralis TaxID=6334 RepID=UPI0001EFC487|nr:30S ribosomal protein S8e [Trichinella spiralis]
MRTQRNAADVVGVTHSRQAQTTATCARNSSGALSDDHKGEQQLVVAPPGGGDATKTPSAWRAKRRTKRTKLQSVGGSPNQISKQIARDDRMVLLAVHAGHPPCR